MENIASQVGVELENETKTTSKHNDSFYEDETDEQLTQACGMFFRKTLKIHQVST
jgi:hypothetical protein